MALPPGAIGSAVREEKLAWRESGVKSALAICFSSNHAAQQKLPIFLLPYLA
jgi:hypothetical protein